MEVFKPHQLLTRITGWWFQPIWKIFSSNWKSSPNRGENRIYLKPPPRWYIIYQNIHSWHSVRNFQCCTTFSSYKKTHKKHSQQKKQSGISNFFLSCQWPKAHHKGPHQNQTLLRTKSWHHDPFHRWLRNSFWIPSNHLRLETKDSWALFFIRG